MGVCKYFMEGYCKFGTRCKFDHVDPYRGYDSPRNADYSSERPQGTSILKADRPSFGGPQYTHPQHGFVQPQQSFGQHSFNQPPQQGFGAPSHQNTFVQKPSGLKYNVQEIIQIVMRDIAQLEKGNQWQLSCYSPLKDLPNMPGLEDYSFEELRWECYKALQNGSLPLCQVIVQQLFGNVAKINNELKRKDSGYSIIDRWLRDIEQRTAQNTIEQIATPFSSSFGGINASASAFSSPFFKPESQAQQTPSAASSFSFSLSPQQPSNAQPFQQTGSVFSNNQISTSNPSNQTTSPFGTSNQATSVFGSPSNQPTSVFGSSNQAASAFGSSNQTTSAFGSSNQTTTSPFGSNNHSTPFASSNQTTSAFASQRTSTFSSPLRTQAQVVSNQVYSSSEALSEAELKAFQADRFVLGSIPIKPPPRALCNL